MFQIVNDAGVTVRGINAEDRIVAIIFAPGNVLAGQSRSFLSGSFCGKDYANFDAYLDVGGGVDNSDVDSSKLYTQPEEVAYAYEELLKVSPNFTIAASFGNVHGVYKPGNVKLTPKILLNSQNYIEDKYKTGKKPGEPVSLLTSGAIKGS